MSRTVELLAPAGSFEKLEIAIHYGADAVYLAGKDFSLRNFSGNFSVDEMDRAVQLAHDNGVRVYVACNIFPRNPEIPGIADFLTGLGAIKPDAVIIADPGIFMLARQIIPHIPVHISTQANITSFQSALFWKNLGASRIISARELCLEEIKEMARQTGMEIEAFVHGAMCISYSGRCLLSNFMTRRDSNRGKCAHPCRWNYAVMEETRPGQYMPVDEDDRGTYIFNSRDICMIDHLPALIDSGITSLKIEGRMKGINYLASVVKVYREAIDFCLADPGGYRVRDEWRHELESVSHRPYGTGFYLNDPDAVIPAYDDPQPSAGAIFLGKILESDSSGISLVDVRNKFCLGDRVEIIGQKGPSIPDDILQIWDGDGIATDMAQTGRQVKIQLNHAARPFDLIRKKMPL
ncbi:MAG: U32 family peptidase [Desulfatirhabdiaceae bacterium]